MGRPESGRHALTDQYAHQAHCRTYQKSSNDANRLHLWPLHASISTWKYGNAPVTRLARIFQPLHSTIPIPRVRRHDGTHTNATPRLHAYDARSTRTTNAMLPAFPSNERRVRATLEHDARLPDVPTAELPSLPPYQRHKPHLSIFLPRPTSHHNRELGPDYYMRRSKNPRADSRHGPELQHSHHRLGRWQWPAPRIDQNANSGRGPVRCDNVR